MTWAVGLALGSGLVLIASPWLWPRAARPDAGAAGRPVLMSALRTRLAQAGLARVQPSVFVVVSLVFGAGLGAGVLGAATVPVLAVAAGAAGAVAPLVLLSGRARRRRRMLREAWPDLVDHLVSGVRSGQGLTAAVARLAEVGPVDFRPAFREFARVASATGTVGPALDALKDHLSDPVADRIVETLRMSRDVGGTELPAVLRNLSAYLRQEGTLRAEVEARQSWVMNAARLGVAAPWIVLVLLASRPVAAAAYNSPPGLALIGIGAVVSVGAYRVIVALGRLPDERRWFA